MIDPEHAHQNPKRGEEVLAPIFQGMMLHRLLTLPEEVPEGQRIRTVLDDTRRHIDAFPEADGDLNELIAELSARDYDGKEVSFAQEFAHKVARILLAQYSPREVEERIRSFTIAERGWQYASDVLAYEIDDNAVIVLHVPPMFSRSILEVAAMFQQGLRKLAENLRDKQFDSIKKISGTSNMVFKYRDSLQKAGWTMTNIHHATEQATAEMSKDDFIKGYGENPG